MSGQIKIENVSMRFGQGVGEIDAIHNVSLHINPSEFVTLIGPSGCGKSTLLSMVAGFQMPTEGTVKMDDKEIEGPGADRGVVFQQYSLFPWLTVRKNVEFGLKMKGINSNEREKAARILIGLAGLSAFENHYPDMMSGGMKQRVGIVRALATSPQVLLMDEPFGALDAQTRVVMQQILTNMWQRFQISVLFITHDIDEAIFLSDRVYVMTARPGCIKAEIPINLPRPRSEETMVTPEFLRLKLQLRKLIGEESLKAMGGELKDGGLEGFSINVGPNGVTELL